VGSIKSVYTWHNVELPAPPAGFPAQQLEIPGLPTKGLLRRVRLVSASTNRIQYWLSNQDFTLGGVLPVPNGGQVSLISAQTLGLSQPIDQLGAELRSSNGVAIGTNQGVPFELIETGESGSKTGSIFIAWEIATAGGTLEVFELQLVIEPLVT